MRTKRAVGMSERAGQGVWPVRGSIRSDLMLFTYCLFSKVFMRSLRLVLVTFGSSQK